MSMVARREVFSRVGFFDPGLGVCEDLDWYVRAAEAGVVIDLLDDVVLERRIHERNLSHDQEAMTRGALAVLRRKLERSRRRDRCPTISVVIPCHDHGAYLDEALVSVLSQSRTPLEVVVVDDGSTDDTPEVAARWAPWVRLVRQAKGGVGSARNAATPHVVGDAVLWLDADDRLAPGALGRLADVLAAGADIARGRIDEFLTPGLDAATVARLRVPQTGVDAPLIGGHLVRRQVLLEVGPFDETLGRGEGVDWLHRAATAGLATTVVDAVTVERRFHTENSAMRDPGRDGEYLRVARASARPTAWRRRRHHHPVMRPPVSGVRLPGWPDPVFDDLLRAAAGPSVTAADAWRRFHRAFDLDRVDGDSYRLLATVAGNLDATVHPDLPDRARIAGIARRTWFANQRAYANLARAVEGLGERGIEVLVAKGGALAVQAFPGVAHRPFSDIDIYVRPDRRRDATDWFLREGYEPSGWIRDLDGRHAVGFVRGGLGGGDVFDLHALPPDGLRLRRHPERSADVLWEGSVPLVHGPVTTRALGPAEQLVLVLVHGLDVRSESPLRGFADAAWIIRSTGGTLDWARVLAFANALARAPRGAGRPDLRAPDHRCRRPSGRARQTRALGCHDAA